MAKDFKAGQIKTSKIIGKSGEKTVFYTHDEAGGTDDGSSSPDVDTATSDIGDDVSFVFSGTEGVKDGTDGGVTLFTGDIVVSGTLYAEKQVIEVESTVPSGLTITGKTPVVGSYSNTAIHIDGPNAEAIVWDGGTAAIQKIEGSSLKILCDSDIAINPNTGQRVIINNPGNDVDFRVESNDNQGAILSDSAENAVLFNVDATSLSAVSKYEGGAGGTGVGTDVNFHVGWDGLGIRDTAVFEGDLVVSGSLTIMDGTGIPISDSFTLSASTGTPQVIAHGDAVLLTGNNGIETESTTAGEIISRLDINSLSTLVPAVADSADLLIVQDTSTGNTRKVAIGNLPASGGSIGGPGVLQIADVIAGKFDAAASTLYDVSTLKTTFGTDHLGGTGTARLNIASRFNDPSPGPTVYMEQITTGGSDNNPVLKIVGDTGHHSIPTVEINSKTDWNTISITNNFLGSPKITNIKLLNDDFTIKNENIDGSTSLIGTRIIDPYYTTGNYDVIKGTKGPTANEPTVTILTNPGVPPISVLNSNDINFYVEGTPGTLGSLGPKGSAQFGGDLQAIGCVARGGIMQLYIDAVQNYTGAGTVGSYSTVVDPNHCDNVNWTSSIIPLDSFYTWSSPGISGNADILINKSGYYKISYSVNFSQIKPSQNRTNMKTWLHDASIPDPVDSIICSEAWSYGRGLAGGFTSKMTNAATTIVSLSAGTTINLSIAFTHGAIGTVSTNPQHQLELNLRADQTWILIEKIGEI